MILADRKDWSSNLVHYGEVLDGSAIYVIHRKGREKEDAFDTPVNPQNDENRYIKNVRVQEGNFLNRSVFVVRFDTSPLRIFTSVR